MRKKIAKIGLATLFSTTLILPTTAFGSSNVDPINEQVNVSNSSISNPYNLTDELVKKVDPYIELIDYKYIINNETDLKKNITQSEFKQVNKMLKEINTHLQAIELETEIYNKYSLETKGDTVVVSLNEESSSSFSIASYEGKRGMEVYWNHVEIYLTKTDVNAILKGGVSGGTAALGALIGSFGGLPGAIAGAAIGAAAGTIVNEYINAVPLVIYIPYWQPIDNMRVYRQ